MANGPDAELRAKREATIRTHIDAVVETVDDRSVAIDLDVTHRGHRLAIVARRTRERQAR